MSAIEGIVQILGPMSSEERQRVVQGALVILGEVLPDVGGAPNRREEVGDDNEALRQVNPRAKTWMKQHQVAADGLTHVFDFSDNDNGVVVIAAALAGKNTAEKVIRTYALTGISALWLPATPSSKIVKQGRCANILDVTTERTTQST